MPTDKKYIVPALLKAFDILDIVADQNEASFSEICKLSGYSKSSAYGLVQTLQAQGCLRLTADNKYKLGLRLFSWGNNALAGTDIRDEAMPIMRDVVSLLNQTCHLGILDGKEAVYLAKAECASNLIVRSWAGKRISLMASAMGKVLLAWRSESEIRALLAHNPPKHYTARATLDIDQYIGQLESVRKNIYALDDRETVDEIRCIAAPVFSVETYPVAALSISAPYAAFPEEQFHTLGRQMCDAAQRLSAILGCTQYPEGNS